MVDADTHPLVSTASESREMPPPSTPSTPARARRPHDRLSREYAWSVFARSGIIALSENINLIGE
jgi:hypothetical protein